MLQRTGGLFTLSANADFGPAFGLVSSYYQTRSANPATAGTVRLASADPGIAFRNNANNANLVITTDASDNLLYNGNIITASANSITPVSRGGTGDSSLTAYAVLTGGTTSTNPVQSVASIGITGQVLTSNGAGALPSFQNTTGSGTVNSGTQYQLAYYAAAGAAISGNPQITTDVGNNLNLNTSSASLVFTGAVNQFHFGGIATTLYIGDNRTVGGTIPNAANTTATIGLNCPTTNANITLSTAATANTTPTVVATFANAGHTFAAPLAMSANKITGLANGSAAQDAVAFGQLPANLPPTGSITMYGGASAPTGWLLCDGTSYTTAGQAALFAVIGYVFGGAGANFSVPNFTNNVPVGTGSIAALGATTGTQTHSITTTEMPVHNHGISDPGHSHNLHTYTTTATNGLLPTGQTGTEQAGSPSTGPIVGATTGITTTNTGSGTAMSLVQPSLGITYIIKT